MNGRVRAALGPIATLAIANRSRGAGLESLEAVVNRRISLNRLRTTAVAPVHPVVSRYFSKTTSRLA